jgi:hypothetical protein
VKRRAPAAAVEQAHITAPIGGINTVDGGFTMPEEDCPLLFNLIGAENGLRSRLGSTEWCTGLTGFGDNTVRSVLPFAGSHKNGATNKLFVCTSLGIYDVSASMDSPPLVVTFQTQVGDAGYGICSVVVNSSGGHFLVYCDEENGYYVYSEATNSWVKVIKAAVDAWVPDIDYPPGSRVSNGGLTYTTVAGGHSAAAPATGPTSAGALIPDNTITWAYAPSITGVDPATLVFVMVWKNRLWFIQKDTGTAWYLPIGAGTGGALFGAAVPFNFGAQFKNGGPLVGLYSWTIDGGSGPDDRLVAVSGGGDVVIYAGTDPSQAATFGIVGRWYVGGVPAGRRIATENGGDLLILSTTGIIPLSKLVLGSSIEDISQYSTHKISNLFSLLASTYSNLAGWSMRIHPEDNCLIVAVPVADGQPTNQLVMPLVTRGWSQYRDLPILSMEAWNGKLYFGTADGRVCINTGYLDGVVLSDVNASTPIICSGITRFDNLGRGTQKQVTQIRPTIISEGGTISESIEARYRYDLTEASLPEETTNPGDSLWDSAVWDVAKYAADSSTQQNMGGAVGMGPDAAIAFKLAVTSKTVILGFDIEYFESRSMT